ncbi:hypothetical protein E3P99_03451 [Wallemia hederae]|uniref:Uncharacterized protein n=1 Tax=Wallemia hederae TaxID=1540922 RepID=A0A4T0FHS0_9BASI|nr:hypothetical protein E3P99_03451 [Wallemia hederae]
MAPVSLSKAIKTKKPNRSVGKHVDKLAYLALLCFLQRTAQETRIVSQEIHGHDHNRKMTRREVGRGGRRALRRVNANAE